MEIFSHFNEQVFNIFGAFCHFGEKVPFFCANLTSFHPPIPPKLWKGTILTNRKKCGIIISIGGDVRKSIGRRSCRAAVLDVLPARRGEEGKRVGVSYLVKTTDKCLMHRQESCRKTKRKGVTE